MQLFVVSCSLVGIQMYFIIHILFLQEIKVATVSQERQSPAYFCGLRVSDKVIAYSSATQTQLDHFCRSGNCEAFIEYVRNAYSEKKHLLLALHRPHA